MVNRWNVTLAYLALTSTALGATINVPADHPTIQGCIDSAVDGDECVVAPSTYLETISFNGKAITVRSSDPLDPLIVESTIIDGNGIGPVVTCDTNEGPDTVLSGITITGGNSFSFGGGMFNSGSSPTVNHCIFDGNEAFFGGGMGNEVSDPTLNNCTFRGNIAAEGGGGIFSYNGSAPTINFCVFDGNAAGGNGGGMGDSGSNVAMAGCLFVGNTSGTSGGGSSIGNGGSATVTDCSFIGNTSVAGVGGGLRISSDISSVTRCSFIGNTSVAGAGGGLDSERGQSITDCVFTNNSAEQGGAISISSGDPVIDQCVFIQNSAVLNGGGMYNWNRGDPIVANSVFAGNVVTQGDGGGMYSAPSSSPTLIGCVFTGNQASASGAGMYNNDASNTTMTNCTFSGNVAGTVGGALFNADESNVDASNCILWGDSPDEIVSGTGSHVVSFSNVEGGLDIGTTDGGGNIDAAPLFVDADGTDNLIGTEDDDLRLVTAGPSVGPPPAGSPCIDAGDNTVLALAGVTTDLDGNPRFADDPTSADTGVGPAPVVDMGAYEVVRVPNANRYLRFSTPQTVAAGVVPEVVRVRVVSLDGFAMPSPDVFYVGPPFAAPEEDTSQPGLTFKAARLQCAPYTHAWSSEGVVAAYGGEIMPSSSYDVQYAASDCPNLETDESCWSAVLTIDTGKFADIVAPFFVNPGDIEPSFLDITAVVSKFLGDPTAPIKAVSQVQPNTVFPNRPIDFKDINAYVLSFLGTAYADTSFASGPCLCPSTVTCGATACISDVSCSGGLCIDGFCNDACGRCSP